MAMKIVGLTGGIASGKSTVARMFAALGATIRSADEDARAVLANGSPLLRAVLDAFPEAATPNGGLDRARLGARIFADPDARKHLEELLHPAIIARMNAAITQARAAGPGVLVYETPLLYEANLGRLFDTVVALVASEETRRERLQAREQAAGRAPLSSSALDDRLTAQLSSEEKARRADFVLRTDGSLAETEAQVRVFWREQIEGRLDEAGSIAVV